MLKQRNNHEAGSSKNLDELKQDLQIDIHDLYFQRLLEQEEALSLLKIASEAKNIDELCELERKFYDSDAFFVRRNGESVDEFIEIENFKIFFDKIIDNVEVSNWKEKIILLLEKINQSYIQDYHEILIKSWLAKFLEQVYQSYITENIDIQIFGNQLQIILAEFAPKLPAFLKTAGGIDLERRKPSFIESVDGTMERFYKIEELEDILEDLTDGIIVGGSMSYGPFFNIRKSLDETGSSDIDLIIILKEDKLDASLWNKLQNSDIISEGEKDIFFERMKKFRDLFKKGEADVFSQKFSIQGTDFDVSIHFFAPSIFDKMTDRDFGGDLSANKDKVATIRDYKAKEFPHKVCAQQNFLGEKYEYSVPPQRQVDGGVIVELPSYIIQNQHFYPGIYQNLISPCFSISYDRTGNTSKRVAKFKDTMEKRLQEEMGEQPRAELLKSHIRYRIFSPELFKKYQQ
ncbi:MAG: hypothetical protein WCX08_03385 [Candidatus Buchananbacteria bacterium]|jgi:hypothetical protein